jgi:hypothetical protein
VRQGLYRRNAFRRAEALEELAAVAKLDTLLVWYRKLIANKFDGSRFRQRVGRSLGYSHYFQVARDAGFLRFLACLITRDRTISLQYFGFFSNLLVLSGLSTVYLSQTPTITAASRILLLRR